MTQIILTETEITRIVNKVLSGDVVGKYAAAYREVLLIDNERRAAGLPTLDAQTRYWFERAPEINADNQLSAANIFIRSATLFGLTWDGLQTGSLQPVSNAIGDAVVSGIRDSGVIPSFNEMLQHDIQKALAGGQTIGGWGGSFYYWNAEFVAPSGAVTTVGQYIINTPEEFEKFISVNAMAFSKTLQQELAVQPFWEFEASEFLGSINAQVPLWVTLEILNRVASVATSGSYAGDPNVIQGWTYGYHVDDPVWYQSVGGSMIFASPELHAKLDMVRIIRLDHQDFGITEPALLQGGVVENGFVFTLAGTESQVEFDNTGTMIGFSKQLDYGRGKVLIGSDGNIKLSIDGLPIDAARQQISLLASGEFSAGVAGTFIGSWMSGQSTPQWNEYFLDVERVLSFLSAGFSLNGMGLDAYLYNTSSIEDYYWGFERDGSASDETGSLWGWLIDTFFPSDGPGQGAPQGGVTNYRSNIRSNLNIKDDGGEVILGPLVMESAPPVVLDLDGDGVELISPHDSTVYFNSDPDRFFERTGWVSADDALLVIDLDLDGNAGADGQITRREEVQFKLWDSNASSDLEGVRLAFDSNHDGVLDASDARFSEFRIWQDVNQNGKADSGELRSLLAAGITSISLASDGQQSVVNGNNILGHSSYTKSDGSIGLVADVELAFNPNGLITLDASSPNLPGSYSVVYQGNIVPLTEFHILANSIYNQLVYDSHVSAAKGFVNVTYGEVLDDLIYNSWLTGQFDVLLETAGGAVAVGNEADVVNFYFDDGLVGKTLNLYTGYSYSYGAAFGSEGDDHFYISQAYRGVTLSGGGGNDILEGSMYSDTLIGGAGVDTLRGGAGDDLIYFDSDDIEIDGGTGIDTVIAELGSVVSLDLGASSIEIAYGADGADVFYTTTNDSIIVFGGGGDDVLTGRDGDDSLFGEAGSDTLVGGAGADQLFGGDGDDVLDGGIGNDVLMGGLGDDIIVFKLGYGTDVVLGFDGGALSADAIELSGFNANTFSSLQSLMVEYGGDTHICFEDGSELILKNLSMAQLHADDFRFVA